MEGRQERIKRTFFQKETVLVDVDTFILLENEMSSLPLSHSDVQLCDACAKFVKNKNPRWPAMETGRWCSQTFR